MDMADVAAQTVTQLRDALKKRGLSTVGVKADLVKRLTEALAQDDAPQETAHVVPPTAAQPTGIPAENTAQDTATPVEHNKNAEIEQGPPVNDLEEAEKLKKRAERFGLSIDDAQKKIDEAAKRAERAERFGEAPSLTTSRLDKALTNRRGHGRGRGRNRGRGGRGGRQSSHGRYNPYNNQPGPAINFSSEDEAKRQQRLQRFEST